ncbi:MAG: transcriptional regulator [Rhodobacteraceae bacterium]|nr:transcriptional regulator [Paracoccaceae bacterium]
MPPSTSKEDPVQRQIDENLKRIFDETAQEPLPEKLTALLDQLRKQEPGR